LFLNNNFHFAHHASPHLPWYDLPHTWRAMAPQAQFEPGLLFSGGYSEVARMYLFTPFIAAVHPDLQEDVLLLNEQLSDKESPLSSKMEIYY